MARSGDDEPVTAPELPVLHDPNPLWAAWQQAMQEASETDARDRLVAQFAFAVPTEPALQAILDASPHGVIEVGAGTGYWARLLHERGGDVVAIDTAPAPSPENRWFAATPAWFDVARGDHTVVDAYSDRTLLLVWPTRNEVWAGDAVQRFAASGGTTIAYVGEPPDGRSGDDRFHALLGEIDRCWSCAYNFATKACLCGTTPLFARSRSIDLPQWPGFDDELRLYTRDPHAQVLSPKPSRRKSRRR